MAGPCAGCVPERHSRAWDGLRHMATASPRHLSMGVMRHAAYGGETAARWADVNASSSSGVMSRVVFPCPRGRPSAASTLSM